MEQRGVVLGAIAKVLNAGGSALVTVYDAMVSIKTGVGQGEKGRLKARLRACEKKLVRLYVEIGKEVAQREPGARMSAAGEAVLKLAAENRAEIERIKQHLIDLEIAEKAARDAAMARARKRAAPAAKPGEPAAAEAQQAREVSTDTVTEKAKEIVAAAPQTLTQEIATDLAAVEAVEAGDAAAAVVTEEAAGMPPDAAEAPEDELQEGTPDAEAPAAKEAAPDAVTEAGGTGEALENLLKSDLLKLCQDKGIEADKRMTKSEIIELIRERL